MIDIRCGDSVEELRKIGTGTIELAVTSPPYNDLRLYAGHTWDFEETARELYRVLCGGGVLCWNVKDSIVDDSESLTTAKQRIFFREECGFRIHQTIIYQKRNFSHPDASRYHDVFEYVMVLSKGKLRAWNPIEDRKNLTAGCIGNLGVNTFTERDGSKSERSKGVTREIGKRHNVWLGNTRGQEDMCEKLPHPAMMPKWLAHDLILSYSNTGDTVLDPFGGSGTSAREAIQLGRKAIIIDINPDYMPIIKQETNVTPGFQLA